MRVDWARLKRERREYFPAEAIPLIDYRNLDFNKPPSRSKDSGSITGGPRILLREPVIYRDKKGNENRVSDSGLWTWTTKMACPSYSLQAGHPLYGGTCPAADPSIVEAKGDYKNFHAPFSRMRNPGKKDGDKVICSVCYAGGGRYGMYIGLMVRQVLKYHWTKLALQHGTFVDLMTQALELTYKSRDILNPMGIATDFFRIHDSGDFFNILYYKAWKQICANLDGKIKFWAPTRVWVYKNWRNAMLSGGVPRSLALRPSALYTSAWQPVVPGMAAGTCSFPRPVRNPRAFDCPVYRKDEIRTCHTANCRRCWGKTQGINYPTH